MDLSQNLIIARGVKPDAHAIGGVTGDVIDTKNARNAVVLLDVADIGASGTIALSIKECATSGGTFTEHTAVAAKTATGQYEVEVAEFKRYLRIDATVATDAVDASAAVIAGNLRESKNLIS